MKDILLIGSVVICCAQASLGQISYVSGVQTSSGGVRTNNGGVIDEETYSLSAPVGTASWSPETQTITASADGVGTHSRLTTTYSSMLAPDRLAFQIDTLDARNSGFTGGSSHWWYDKAFDLTFRLDTPQQVTIVASLRREMSGGWTSGTPFSMSLSRVGESPIFSFSYDGLPPSIPYTQQFPPTALTLPAGDYRLLAINHNSWGGGSHGSNINRDYMSFALVVPAPASLFSLGLAAIALTPKRRRSA